MGRASAAGTAAPWRSALITGASSGIGLAFARALAAQGVRLTLVARDGTRLDEVADELRAAHEVKVETVSADLRTAAGLAEVGNLLRAEDEPVDLLVNNAGVGTRGAFATLDPAAEADVVALSVTAVLELCHSALPGMLARRQGWIVNVASLAAMQPTPLTATYGAAKAFSLSLSEALYDELRGTGVHVSALCPSFTATEFHTRAGVDVSRVPSGAWLDPAVVAEAGLRAVARGRPVCVPGLAYRVLAAASSIAPRPLARYGSRLFAKAR